MGFKCTWANIQQRSCQLGCSSPEASSGLHSSVYCFLLCVCIPCLLTGDVFMVCNQSNLQHAPSPSCTHTFLYFCSCFFFIHITVIRRNFSKEEARYSIFSLSMKFIWSFWLILMYGDILHSLEEKKSTLFFWINELIFHEKKFFALFFWINELIFHEKKNFALFFWINELIFHENFFCPVFLN